MKSNETTTWTRWQTTQKFRQLFSHPFTFVVLVWGVLLLAFYILSKFI